MSRILTLTEIAQKVTRRLSLYPGTGVQLYAEDRIKDMIQSTFEFIFDDYFWPQFCSWNQWTLNGTTGEVTADISAILKRWEDLSAVMRDGSNKKLPRVPDGMNPFTITGETPRFIEPYNANGRIFRVWPLECVTDIVAYVRTIPDEYVDDDVIDFDSEALILGATYHILEDDGTVPGGIEKYRSLFERRVSQLKVNVDQMPIPLVDTPRSNVPVEWDGTNFVYGWRP